MLHFTKLKKIIYKKCIQLTLLLFYLLNIIHLFYLKIIKIIIVELNFEFIK